MISVTFRYRHTSSLESSTMIMLLGFGAWVLHAAAAYSLAVLLDAHFLCCLLFTTLFAIDMNFEDLSILKTGQVLVS